MIYVSDYYNTGSNLVLLHIFLDWKKTVVIICCCYCCRYAYGAGACLICYCFTKSRLIEWYRKRTTVSYDAHKVVPLTFVFLVPRAI